MSVDSWLAAAPPEDSIFEIEERLEKADSETAQMLLRCLPSERVEEGRRRARLDLRDYERDPSFNEFVERMTMTILREGYPLPILTLL